MPLVPSADDLLVRLRATEAAFARDARRQRARWRYRIDRRRILFDRETRAAHRRFRQSLAAFLRESTLANALTAPLIYSLAVPLVRMIAYIRDIAARTEQYWCPIKHGGQVRAPHAHYPLFPEYGDAAGYRSEAPALRAALSRPRALGNTHGQRVRAAGRRAS